MITFKYKDWEVLKIEKPTDITKDMGPYFTDVVFSEDYVIKHTTNSSYWLFNSEKERDYVYYYIKKSFVSFPGVCTQITIPDYTNLEDGKAKEPKIHHPKPTIRHIVKYQKHEIEMNNFLGIERLERTDKDNYALYIKVSNKTFGTSLRKLEFKSKEEMIYLGDKLKEIQNAILTYVIEICNVNEVTCNQLNEIPLDNIGWKCDINRATGDQTATYTIPPFIALKVEPAHNKENVDQKVQKVKDNIRSFNNIVRVGGELPILPDYVPENVVRFIYNNQAEASLPTDSSYDISQSYENVGGENPYIEFKSILGECKWGFTDIEEYRYVADFIYSQMDNMKCGHCGKLHHKTIVYIPVFKRRKEEEDLFPAYNTNALHNSLINLDRLKKKFSRELLREENEKEDDGKDEKEKPHLYMNFEQVLPFYKAGKRITREAYHKTGYKELDMLPSLFIISDEDLIDNISHKCLIANDWYVVE